MSSNYLECKDAKDPQESTIFTMDWRGRLGTSTLLTSTWKVWGLTMVDESLVVGDQAASIQVSGGRAGQDYLCRNTVTTSDGEVWQRTGIVKVRQL